MNTATLRFLGSNVQRNEQKKNPTLPKSRAVTNDALQEVGLLNDSDNNIIQMNENSDIVVFATHKSPAVLCDFKPVFRRRYPACGKEKLFCYLYLFITGIKG